MCTTRALCEGNVRGGLVRRATYHRITYIIIISIFQTVYRNRNVPWRLQSLVYSNLIRLNTAHESDVCVPERVPGLRRDRLSFTFNLLFIYSVSTLGVVRSATLISFSALHCAIVGLGLLYTYTNRAHVAISASSFARRRVLCNNGGVFGDFTKSRGIKTLDL